MGVRYSKIANPLSRLVEKTIQDMLFDSLLELRGKLISLGKKTGKKGIYFINKQELRDILEWKELQIYYSLKLLSIW